MNIYIYIYIYIFKITKKIKIAVIELIFMYVYIYTYYCTTSHAFKKIGPHKTINWTVHLIRSPVSA